MTEIERRQRLHAMMRQIAPNNAIEEIPRPRTALESLPESQKVVESGLQKYHEGRLSEVTNEEQFALEAIVMPKNRPCAFVRGHSYDDFAEPWTSLNAPAVKSRISCLLSRIGRLELPRSPLIPYGGTAFVVGENCLITNRHVAVLFSRGLGTKIVYQPGGCAIDFKRQVDTPDSDRSAYLLTIA